MGLELDSKTPYLSNRAIERASLDKVNDVLSNVVIFPFVERIIETKPNGYCDAEEKIDVVVFTGEPFAVATDLDTICIQVKSSEDDMKKFFGEISKNGKPINKFKFLNVTGENWILNSMLYLDGRWGNEIMSADVMYQICALKGYWPDRNKIKSFVETECGRETFSVMCGKEGLIRDYRGFFLNWVSANSRLL